MTSYLYLVASCYDKVVMLCLFLENIDSERRRKITEALTSIRKDLVSFTVRTHLGKIEDV